MKAPYEKQVSDFHCRSDGGGTTALEYHAHLHYNIEILYMEDGEVKVNIDSDTYEITRGNLLVIFPNHIHRFEKSKTTQKYKLFIINPDLVPELAASFRDKSPVCPVIPDVCDNPRLRALIDCVFDAESLPRSMRDIVLKGYVTALFGEILSVLPLSDVDQYDSHALKAVVDYCSKNFTHELSLTLLEKELHLSKYYISHLFSKRLGVRFNDYINSLRLSEACRLLKSDELSITEISLHVGFGTLRTFNRAFFKQMGETPSDYRRNNKRESVAPEAAAEGGSNEY